jgi:HEAT repeat protein
MTRAVLILVAILVGCGKSSPPPKHIEAWVTSWADMGMYLPDKEQIDFIEANLKDVAPELVAALSHKNPDIRQRAAYVIREIGEEAHAMGPDLFAQYILEKEQIVRIYLVDAIGAVGFREQKVRDALRSEFDTLSSDNVATSFLASDYAEVDQKINLASALYRISNDKDRQEYLEFVTQWLQRPSPDLSFSEKEGYWERRWMAVVSLESMDEANSAIPLLESMLKEDDAKPWVSHHVPRVLEKLNQQAK